MPHKAVIIKFRGASIFTNRKPSNDKAVTDTGWTGRDKAPRLEVPDDTLDARHVSNLLHVLMGERPVPTLRRSAMRRDESIYQCARRAVVRIEETSREETKTVRKAVKDSWNTATLWYELNGKQVKVKGGLLYHERLMRFLGDALYGSFLDVLGRLTGSSNPRKEYTAHRGIEILNAHGNEPLVKKFSIQCRKGGRTALANLLETNGNTASITFHQGTGSRLNILVVNKGVEKVRRVSGTIFVPVESDELLNRLTNGTGVATLLEGGFASLSGVEDWSEDLIHGGKTVSEVEISHVSDQGA